MFSAYKQQKPTLKNFTKSLLEVLEGYWKLLEMAENLENQIWKWTRNKPSLEG